MIVLLKSCMSKFQADFNFKLFKFKLFKLIRLRQESSNFIADWIFQSAFFWFSIWVEQFPQTFLNYCGKIAVRVSTKLG